MQISVSDLIFSQEKVLNQYW